MKFLNIVVLFIFKYLISIFVIHQDFGVIVMSDLVLETRPCPWLFMEYTALSRQYILMNEYMPMKDNFGKTLLIFILINRFNID